MKSSPHAVGQFNLRGRKTAVLSCGCCDIRNFKEDERIKEAEEEMREAKLTSPDAAGNEDQK